MTDPAHRRTLRADQLLALDDAALRIESMHYKQSLADIETTIASSKERGEEIHHATRVARNHYKSALGIIKDINASRGGAASKNSAQVGELMRAVALILDDPTDADWDRLQAAYEAFPIESREKIEA